MPLSAFADKSQEPRAAALREVLGRSGARWKELIDHLEAVYAPLTARWGFAGAQWGWALRLKQKKRTILYMTPCSRHFVVGFVLGERAVEAAHAVPLGDSMLALINEAPRYAEGRGIRIEVRTRKDLESIKQLTAVKMAH